MTIIVFDFETDGLNPYHAKIIEYAFINFYNDKCITELINPDKQISSKITSITNITNEMLIGKPSIKDKTNEIYNFLESNHNNSTIDKNNIYMIAHNVNGFDKFFLKRIFENNPFSLKFYRETIVFIDTIDLAKLVLPTMRSVSLATLCKIFNIVPGTHRALDDTKALQTVYKKLVQLLASQKNLNYEVLINNPRMIWDILY